MITPNIFMPRLCKKGHIVLHLSQDVGQSVEQVLSNQYLKSPLLDRLSTQVLGSKCLGLNVKGQTILKIDMMTVL